MIAAGLHGLDNELALPPAFGGNAYVSDAPRVPSTLERAAELLEGSAIARAAMGDVVVDHYTNAARVDVAAFNAAVTDWERFRSFERM
jgi:glutamine synthetase